MNWLTEAFDGQSTVQAVIILSLVSAIGLSLGKLKIFGVSLGITFVFFTGIIAGHFGLVVDPMMLMLAQNFGLILFVYALGLQVGPGFFSSFKKSGIKLNTISMALILLGLIFTLVFHWTTGIPLSDMVGLLCGAVTNTPALGAGQQALLQMDPGNTKGVTDMALACAVTYPLGVVGVILAIIVLKALFFSGKEQTMSKEESKDQTKISEFRVSNPAIFDKSVREVVKLSHMHFVISRIWRNGKVSIPTSDVKLEPNDHLLVISSKGDLENIRLLFGMQEEVDWNKEDINWDAIDSQLISRRIVVTRDKINGVRLGSLRLRNLYGINITRVNRAGIDLIASPNLHLQLGDKLTIVGEANSVKNVGKILGDEIKRLDNPNLIAIFLGISMGVLLGLIPIQIPGLSTPIKLGIAGGPIIVGILMGAFGPRFHMTTYTTQSANLMIRQLGIVIYLGGLGLQSGGQFFETVFSNQGLIWVSIGFCLTLVPVLLVGFITSRFLHVDYAQNIGMLCGSMANPMALSYANTTVEGDEPSVTYATVYPLSMFIRVISAQLILLLFS
ncbi:putative transporter [Parabacteroides sp. Marseille-P3160]|uniref:putative transporter n=1 Tax=Parabacteroides sp. Marseille-P3160 TaxID=1917887 RepID=UPI0009BA0041|nr:putative transporter [Parabacteroides sp. Marseille-P3160]